MTWLKISLFLIVLVLSGCSSFDNQYTQKPANYSAPKTINDIKYWTASGKILLSENGKKQAGNFFWQQADDNFQFVVSTILGIDVFSIKVFNEQTTIYINGEQYTGEEPQSLLFSLTGQTIPLGYIADWMLGKVNASQVSALKKDENGLVQHFIFDGENSNLSKTWSVQYVSRINANSFLLPQNIVINSTTNRIKMKINDWKID